MTYFDKHKRKIFPWIKDWTNPYNELRRSKNIGEMSLVKYFFFDVAAYNIAVYSFYILSILIFGSLGLYLFEKHPIISPIMFLFTIYLMGKFIKVIKNRKLISNTNFYDILMREYDG